VLGPRRALERLEAQLRALSPLAVLARGYSLTTDASGRVLTSATQTAPGERVRTRLADGGAFTSRVEGVEPPIASTEGRT
jgi:exodeoxyribonuclease VII large subunit